MARTAENAWKDLWYTSGVEQRVKDYKNLISELDDAIEKTKEAMLYLDAVEEDLKRMANESADSSSGFMVEEFEAISFEVKAEFDKVYGKVDEMYQSIQAKKSQAETQLEYYKGRKSYENQLNRDLQPHEYSFNG